MEKFCRITNWPHDALYSLVPLKHPINPHWSRACFANTNSINQHWFRHNCVITSMCNYLSIFSIEASLRGHWFEVVNNDHILHITIMVIIIPWLNEIKLPYCHDSIYIMMFSTWARQVTLWLICAHHRSVWTYVGEFVQVCGSSQYINCHTMPQDTEVHTLFVYTSFFELCCMRHIWQAVNNLLLMSSQ